MGKIKKIYFDIETKLKNKPLKFYILLLIITLVA
jgi:hypothetical protein